MAFGTTAHAEKISRLVKLREVWARRTRRPSRSREATAEARPVATRRGPSTSWIEPAELGVARVDLSVTTNLLPVEQPAAVVRSKVTSIGSLRSAAYLEFGAH